MIKRLLLSTFAVAACATATGQLATSPLANPTAEQAGVRTVVPRVDREFIRNAARAMEAQLQGSLLALVKANDPLVREFAQQMVDRHSEARDRLQRLARSKGVVLPASASESQQHNLKLLRTAEGVDFELRYAGDFGVAAHRRMIGLMRDQVQRGNDPDIKAFAQQTLPTLEDLLRRGQALHASVQIFPHTTRAGEGQIVEAVQVVQRMKSDPYLADVLRQAKAIFILPDYGRVALGLGVQAGQGLLVARNEAGFGNPVFYRLGGISVGAQAGVSQGELALLLMTDKAVRDFRSGKKFSLNADAGLTIANYSRRVHASAGKVQDVIVWSGTRGAYAGLSIGLNDVMFDEEANRAYYGREGLTPSRIIEGSVPNRGHDVLGMVLSL